MHGLPISVGSIAPLINNRGVHRGYTHTVLRDPDVI